jgi:H+-transporting ATPase
LQAFLIAFGDVVRVRLVAVCTSRHWLFGLIVRQSEMNGLVVTTKTNTCFGKTVKLVEEAQTKSHFQKAIVKNRRYLIVLAVALVELIFYGRSFSPIPVIIDVCFFELFFC